MARVVAQLVDASSRSPSQRKFAQPHQRVVEEEAAHLVGVRVVEVHRRTPGGRVGVGEVRPEARQVIPVRPEMVVDDVHDDADPALMARVDEALQPVRAAVRLVNGVEIDPVVAPAVMPRVTVARKQLHRVDAEVREMVEVRDRAIEGAFGREPCRRATRTARRRAARARASRVHSSRTGRARTPARGPLTPFGCHRERGSGAGSLPSRTNA